MKEKIYGILTNKILIIALLFIAILISFTTSCFAVFTDEPQDLSNYHTFNITYDDDFELTFYLENSIYNYGDYYFAYYYISGNEYYYHFAVSQSPIIANRDGNSYTITNNDNSRIYNRSVFTRANSSVLGIDSFSDLNYQNSFYTSNQSSPLNSYSTHDILNNNGDVVFQVAPGQGETQGIQALTLEQVEEIPQAMTQTLQVVIPVGLVIFGVGLVIFLTRYLILRLM